MTAFLSALPDAKYDPEQFHATDVTYAREAVAAIEFPCVFVCVCVCVCVRARVYMCECVYQCADTRLFRS
jgi:hypothetical protein